MRETTFIFDTQNDQLPSVAVALCHRALGSNKFPCIYLVLNMSNLAPLSHVNHIQIGLIHLCTTLYFFPPFFFVFF